jgi:hypothetical protein
MASYVDEYAAWLAGLPVPEVPLAELELDGLGAE